MKRKAVSCLETRAQNPLEKDSWSYIEVPLAVVEKTKADLRNILKQTETGTPEIPVFATEHVEMLMREKTLAQLSERDKS